MEQTLFVYNPNAGKGRIAAHLDEVVGILEQNGSSIEVYRTKAPLDGKNYVISNIDRFNKVVCSGGDGTLSEIVSAMMEISPEKRVPIGFIPTGSTNDTGKSYGLPHDIKEAAQIAAMGKPFSTDIGKMNEDYFTYVASFGKLSAVSCFTPQEEKKALGYGAYVVEGLKALLKMESYKLTIEYVDETDKLHKESGNYYLGMVTNTLSVGGFSGITGNNVALNDGLFEVILLKRPKNIVDFTKQVDNMLLKADKDLSNEVVVKFKAKKMNFTSDNEVQWVIDGENGGLHRSVHIDNNHNAVQIMVKSE